MTGDRTFAESSGGGGKKLNDVLAYMHANQKHAAKAQHLHSDADDDDGGESGTVILRFAKHLVFKRANLW